MLWLYYIYRYTTNITTNIILVGGFKPRFNTETETVGVQSPLLVLAEARVLFENFIKASPSKELYPLYRGTLRWPHQRWMSIGAISWSPFIWHSFKKRGRSCSQRDHDSVLPILFLSHDRRNSLGVKLFEREWLRCPSPLTKLYWEGAAARQEVKHANLEARKGKRKTSNNRCHWIWMDLPIQCLTCALSWIFGVCRYVQTVKDVSNRPQRSQPLGWWFHHITEPIRGEPTASIQKGPKPRCYDAAAARKAVIWLHVCLSFFGDDQHDRWLSTCHNVAVASHHKDIYKNIFEFSFSKSKKALVCLGVTHNCNICPTALHGFIEVLQSSMLAARAERQGERWLGSGSVHKDWFFQLWQSQHVVEWIQNNILSSYQLDNTVWAAVDTIFRGASTDEWWNKETMLGLLVWRDGKGQGDVHEQEFPFGTFKPEISWCAANAALWEKIITHNVSQPSPHVTISQLGSGRRL